MNSTASCPCGSGGDFAHCCGPLLDGVPAPTAEALMRSRYTAFVRGDISYIRATYAPEHRAKVGNDLPPVRWIDLTIHSASGGGPGDQSGTVEFTARFSEDGAIKAHRERSNFRREDQRWVYVDGEIAPSQPAGKIGRNDPCPCGSGKKFKKCCGG